MTKYRRNPPTPPHLLAHACRMRQAPTSAEKQLWQALRRKQLGVWFRRQYPINRYIVDFFCFAHRLIVEVDGDIHDGREEDDHQRQADLETQGYTVLRFTNTQVREELPAVLAEIARHCGMED